MHVDVSGDVERGAWAEGIVPSGHQQSCLRPCTPPAVGTETGVKSWTDLIYPTIETSDTGVPQE